MKQKEIIMDVIQVLLGNLVLAIGVGFFVLPLNILSGGVAGVAVALEPFFHIPPDTMITILTVVLFLSGAILLGKKFAINTLISSIVYPSLVTFFTTNFHIQVTDNVLLGSIFAGAFIGTGVGLVFRTGASTGGMDIPPLIINKFTHIPLPTLVLIFDSLTVCIGVMGYGIEASLYGLVSVFTCSMMVNKVLTFGGHGAKNVMIISNKHEEVKDAIYKEINRGATILQAKGGYTGEERPVIMVVVAKKQLASLQKLILHVDPEAFVVVSDTMEVQGLGFSYQEEM